MIAFIFTLIGILIVVKAAYTMFVQREYWKEVKERFVRENVRVHPKRGNIFSADGQLLATSLPEYKIFMDYMAYDRDSVKRAKLQMEKDSLFYNKLDSVCMGLNRILPDKPYSWYKDRLLEGHRRRSRNWLIYPKRISFIDYKEIKKLPFFNLGPNKSGFHKEEFNECKKPFGSLASRTIGDLYPGKDSARSGLQLAYDTILRGKDGIVHRQKVSNSYIPIVDVPPLDGADIRTTIDVKMQDFCEKAIVDKLKEIGGEVGVVILMEVKTGDVKAIVNMTRCEDGEYREVRNNAVSNLMEPGSVFKPMSFMVAFEDGKIHMNDRVDVAPGVRMMYGRKMKDHNWRRGGYQVLTVPECLEYSSNVGVSLLIDKYYHNNPQQFVNGLYRIGIPEDLHLDIPGYAVPRIRRPKKDGSNWSKTALAWMSIGYETQVPPISVLNFYNGVANGGRMMRPRFVTEAVRDGEVIHSYPPQVVREHMCSPQTLQNIQTCLRWVVSKGLGKKAGSPNFSVSGKTGTAQVWKKGGFSFDYLVSFAGYYPSESPRYSCIVCIQKHGLPASGGGQCGPVFRKIAEKVMSETSTAQLSDAVDTLHSMAPKIYGGNLLYANKVLEDMRLASDIDWAEAKAENNIWGRAVLSSKKVQLKMENIEPGKVPDLKGMGARDALYLMEKLGLRVRLNGIGQVVEQSLPACHLIKKGELITLRLFMKGIDPSTPDAVEQTEDETPAGESPSENVQSGGEKVEKPQTEDVKEKVEDQPADQNPKKATEDASKAKATASPGHAKKSTSDAVKKTSTILQSETRFVRSTPVCASLACASRRTCSERIETTRQSFQTRSDVVKTKSESVKPHSASPETLCVSVKSEYFSESEILVCGMDKRHPADAVLLSTRLITKINEIV